MTILTYDNREHRSQLVELWKRVFACKDRRNDPSLALDKKLEVDNRIYVALEDDVLVGSIMTGYDGHRGWIYSLAVLPEYRQRGIATKLLRHAEQCLADSGCMKINLQILGSNAVVKHFYEKNGYAIEERISMGKQIKENIPE